MTLTILAPMRRSCRRRLCLSAPPRWGPLAASPGLAVGLVATAAAALEVPRHGVGALALAVACTFWIDSALLFGGCLAWLAHIGLGPDRSLGLGLRMPQGCQRG